MATLNFKIESREEALKAVRDSGIAFLVIAAIQALLGFLVAPAVLLDAALYAVLAALLLFLKSRVVAIILVILSLLTLVTTILNRIGLMDSGGNNIFLAFIILIFAVRAVIANFALRRSTADQHRPSGGDPLLEATSTPDPFQSSAPKQTSPPRFTRFEQLLIAALVVLGATVAILSLMLFLP